MVRAPKRGVHSGTRNDKVMPAYDKQNINDGVTRLATPTLSATTAKKALLTPRIASSSPSQVTTPLAARKGGRLELNATPTTSKSASDISTPVSAFLNSNITPRSPSRKSRVDSANTTPSNTPNGTPAPETLYLASDYGTNLGTTGFDSRSSPSTVSFGSTPSEAGSQRDMPQAGVHKKLFYASDAKISAQPSRWQARKNKNSTFFYANGDAIPPTICSSGTEALTVASTIGEERTLPKFFHANGTPEPDSEPPHHFSSQNSNMSAISHFTPFKFSTQEPAIMTSSLQRPKSPPKSSQTEPLSLKKSATSKLSSFPILATGFSKVEELPKSKVPRKVPVHGKTGSIGAFDLSPKRNTSAIAPTTPLSPESPSSLAPTQVTPPPKEGLSGSDNNRDWMQGEIQSPVKAGHSLEHVNELAANARRERKVLDLEITNSSLAAINRTLEREMRKQSAELRRYRRLSRSGRLSINTAISQQALSETPSIVDGLDSTQLSDMSEGDEDESSEESIDSSSLSSTAMAESDARHMKKDEKRLMLDLSKHQQLLVDSQKMNQSLKRCLDWTDELIKEGKKALAYNVRVSDVHLGGRVLSSDEIEDTDDACLW